MVIPLVIPNLIRYLNTTTTPQFFIPGSFGFNNVTHPKIFITATVVVESGVLILAILVRIRAKQPPTSLEVERGGCAWTVLAEDYR